MAAGALPSLFVFPPTESGARARRARIPPPLGCSAYRDTYISLRTPSPPSLLRQSPMRFSIVAGAAGDSFKIGDEDDNRTASTRTAAFFSFVSANFLPIALVSGVALGSINPSPGLLAHQYSLSKFSTFGIFLISGLTLRSSDVGAAREAWPAGLFGLASILCFTPLFAKIILQIHLMPREFVTGLAIFCCMPTTLSSGIALTQLAKGNSALALAMTVLSNLFGIFLVPFFLSSFIGKGAGVPIPTIPLLKSLITMLLIPLILGKIIRDSFAGAGEYIDRNRQFFSRASALLLSLVPWIQVSRSRTLLLSVPPPAFLAAVGMGMFLHLMLLAFNIIALKGASAISGVKGESVFSKKENSRAVILVASQKTLPVTVAVVEQLGGALGESGLLVLPCVAAHIIQIIIDSFIVNKWVQRDQLVALPKEE